jgi:hypothetical protein
MGKPVDPLTLIDNDLIRSQHIHEERSLSIQTPHSACREGHAVASGLTSLARAVLALAKSVRDKGDLTR